MRTLRGVAASPGVAVGSAFLYRPLEPYFERRRKMGGHSGLSLDEFSMNAPATPRAKAMICSLSYG